MTNHVLEYGEKYAQIMCLDDEGLKGTLNNRLTHHKVFHRDKKKL